MEPVLCGSLVTQVGDLNDPGNGMARVAVQWLELLWCPGNSFTQSGTIPEGSQPRRGCVHYPKVGTTLGDNPRDFRQPEGLWPKPGLKKNRTRHSPVGVVFGVRCTRLPRVLRTQGWRTVPPGSAACRGRLFRALYGSKDLRFREADTLSLISARTSGT